MVRYNDDARRGGEDRYHSRQYGQDRDSARRFRDLEGNGEFANSRMTGGARGRRDLDESGYGAQYTRGRDDDYEGWNIGDTWNDDAGGGSYGRGAQSWNQERSASNSGYREAMRHDGERGGGLQRRRAGGADGIRGGERYGDGFYGGESGLGNLSDGVRSGQQSSGSTGRSGYAGGFGDQSAYMTSQDDEFDPDYTRWRDEQMRTFDEDYRAFRTERAKKFGSDFDEFRQSRERASQKSGGAGSRKGASETQT